MAMTELQEEFQHIENKTASLREAYKNAYLTSEFITDGDMAAQMDKLPITIDSFQEGTNWTADYPKNMPPDVYCAVGLAEEIGEFISHTKKLHRDDGSILSSERREKMIAESSDCLFYFCSLLNQHGIKISEVMNYNQKKLLKRLKHNTIHGSGDNR